MQNVVSFGFTHQCAGDLGYVWDDECLALMFNPNPNLFSVHDVRKGGDPVLYGKLAHALNAMLAIAAKYKAPL